MAAAIPFRWRVRAVVASIVIPPLLEIASFARIERFLMAVARLPSGAAPDDVVAARHVHGILSHLPWPWTSTCLRRSAVLYFLLRSQGRDVALCIGVRRDGSRVLRAHAWLVRDGAVYLESDRGNEHAGLFSEIARFPQASPRSL